jgi:hypothetical protein
LRYNPDAEEISGSEGFRIKVADNLVFEPFEATYRDTTSKEELLLALKLLHDNSNLLNILEMLQDYELPDEVLKEKMLGEFRVHVPTMYNYLGVLFKITGVTKDTVIEYLLEEMEILRNFHSKHNTLSFKDTDTIIRLLRHCLLQDVTAEKCIQNKQCTQ